MSRMSTPFASRHLCQPGRVTWWAVPGGFTLLVPCSDSYRVGTQVGS
jgi:hypothetical protein